MKPAAMGKLCLVGLLTVQLSGCGLLLHPERQGQKGGRIDPAVAIFDAAGLLLFLIPGLVAFGVDFYHGTIYLPGTAATGPRVLKMDDPSLEGISRLLERETGQKLDLRQAQVSRYEAKDRTLLLARLASSPGPQPQLAP
ncbi:hypothetical protein [Gallaecimonas xiamenensis]|uniref:Uncharacterized protein n=1 Tax=Gallaecimonas xiamenensis 3-C-1 TaxID=745411 RepID=K2KJA8_9GAMM|nr:hypothetical protein [Gallaecimonas xiamenensis]EKE77395.1 hypothetical protein B3C1_01250 [Gallaecimonas xiamenensis 3-C-1]